MNLVFTALRVIKGKWKVKEDTFYVLQGVYTLMKETKGQPMESERKGKDNYCM